MDWQDLTLADIERLVEAIEQAGGNPDAVKAIIDRTAVRTRPHGRVTIRTLLTLLEQLGGTTVLPDGVLEFLRRWGLSTPLTPSLPPSTATFDELIAACQFGSVDPSITEERFPVVADGTTGHIEELPFSNITGIEALRRIDEMGYRPVGMRRALEYIAGHRAEIQGVKKGIAIIGAVWDKISLVVLDQFELSIFYIKSPYPGRYHYLVTRK